MSDADVTPIDSPLMRSDLRMVRIELEGVRKAMRGLEQLAVNHYNEATATRRETRILTFVCVASAIVSLSCAALGVAQ